MKHITIIEDDIFIKKIIKWFFISLLVFMISIFLHECGHGLANALAGIPCSTGFNKVGDAYKYPSADDFRSYYSTTEPVLIDFGVPCTLVLSVLGAFIYARTKNRKQQYLGAALAVGNSFLRLIPCLMVLLIPLFTGYTHVEDEYETGQLLVNKFGENMWLYLPVIFSIVITAFSLIWVYRTAITRQVKKPLGYATVSFFVFCIGMALASVLDCYIRINWL